MSYRWDSDRYLAFADERGRPFLDLLARVGAADPRTVVDLGCGPGNLTCLLADRWPDAHVLGLDSSSEMIEKARATGSTIEYDVADLRDWQPPQPVDVLVSSATLQWVPGHLDLLPRLVEQVRPGGWFAFQVPANFDEPSHTIRAELATEVPYRELTAGAAEPTSHDPETYVAALTALGCTVDAWETTYLHLLTGEDPVFTWVSGTSARPVLALLPDGLREEFVAEFKQRLRAAYPEHPYGVALPFRRVFAVAQVPA
ncbi:MAG: trans-aconitate 2-methyltransferase [Nocardioides sp.]|nr:trans-aconitate 2-methyltransferase [Nocardioides sp.]